jgi:hypothetical protein
MAALGVDNFPCWSYWKVITGHLVELVLWQAAGVATSVTGGVASLGM